MLANIGKPLPDPVPLAGFPPLPYVCPARFASAVCPVGRAGDADVGDLLHRRMRAPAQSTPTFYRYTEYSRMEISTVYTDQAPEPIGPYSQAKRVGNFVFTAGQIGLDRDGNMPGSVEGQARLALRNLGNVLQAAGCGFDSVVKTTIFLHDMADFAVVNAVYAEYFGESVPARSTVQAARLPKDALVEIEAIGVME